MLTLVLLQCETPNENSTASIFAGFIATTKLLIKIVGRCCSPTLS